MKKTNDLTVQQKSSRDDSFMKKALRLAQKAFDADEVPVGALVVDQEGIIIGRGYNQVEKRNCQRAHAEQLAIQQACAKRKDWRLDNCTLYVTLEPCKMCIGLIEISRIKYLVYGASSPLFGYQLDNEQGSQLYKKSIKAVRPGVLADQAAALLKQFFKRKRA